MAAERCASEMEPKRTSCRGGTTQIMKGRLEDERGEVLLACSSRRGPRSEASSDEVNSASRKWTRSGARPHGGSDSDEQPRGTPTSRVMDHDLQVMLHDDAGRATWVCSVSESGARPRGPSSGRVMNHDLQVMLHDGLRRATPSESAEHPRREPRARSTRAPDQIPHPRLPSRLLTTAPSSVAHEQEWPTPPDPPAERSDHP